MRPIEIMVAYLLPSFPVRSPRAAARCKLPVALRPGLSQERIDAHQRKNKRKRKTKEETMKSTPVPYSSPANAMSEGVGRNSGGSSLAPVSSLNDASSVE